MVCTNAHWCRSASLRRLCGRQEPSQRPRGAGRETAGSSGRPGFQLQTGLRNGSSSTSSPGPPVSRAAVGPNIQVNSSIVSECELQLPP